MAAFSEPSSFSSSRKCSADNFALSPFEQGAGTRWAAAGERQAPPQVVPVHIDTVHAAKTLMDDAFVAPTATDKGGKLKTTTVPARGYLLDRTPDPVY